MYKYQLSFYLKSHLSFFKVFLKLGSYFEQLQGSGLGLTVEYSMSAL
jgi:hypothetical protein